MPKPTGSTAKERIMARANAMGEVSTSGGMTMETAVPTVQNTVGKRERQVVSPGGTFLGGFSYTKPKTRQKTAKELADEQAQYQLSEQEYQRLLGLELDKYRTEVEQAKKKAQESKSPYNIHAFGGYDPNRKTLDERTYEAMLADLNKAESLQYDVKGREALDKLTEEQNAALELLNTERSDTAKRQTAWQTMQQGGYSDEEISRLVNYYRNIPKRERNAEWYAFAQNWAKQQADSDPVGSTIKSIPANLLSGLGTIDAAMRKLSDPDTPTDYNAPAMLPYAYASGVRGEVTKNLQYDHGDTAAFLYGVGTSVLDSGATAALALLGVPPAAASATLGGAAATDAMVAAKDRGLDDTHAIRTGVAAGILESFFEKFSLESLISMKLPTGTAGQKLAGMLKNTAVQAGIEGSEEMFTDIGNLIADKIINGGMADVDQRIYAYMAGGMSYAEAQQKVANETIKDIALDFGAGFLAGGIMGGGNMAVQTAAQRSGRLTVEQYQQFLRDAGMEQDIPESTANTALEEAAEKYGADAEAFRRTYTEGQDTALYDSAYRIAYEYGKAGAKEDAVMQQDSLSYLSEAQRRIAYTVGRDAAAWQSSLGEHGSAAWTEALKSDVENKGRLKAGFTALYQAGLRRESAANVKSAAASALPQSVQTAAYEAGLSDAAASLAREKAGLDFVSSAGSESGLVDNEHARKMAKEQAGTAALLNTLGKNLGVRIEMVDTIRGGSANGQYLSSQNLIQIAADADNAFGFVAAHEVTHRMQELAPEEYRAYRDHAMSYRARESGEEGAAAYVERYRAMAEEAGVKLTQEEAMDEIAADFTRNMMEDGKLFEDFAKENRSTAKKLLDALKAFIAKVKSLFRSKAAQDKAAQDAYGKSMAELEQCVALWQKAYDAAGKQAQKAKTAVREGDGEGRYQLKNFSEQAVSTALYDALSEKATRQNQLIPVSVMPRYISEKLGIGGDIYIQRDHAYENMVSKEQAIQDGRPTQRKGENVHFHDLGAEKMTRAIMSINEPTMTISTKTKDGNPAVIMMLPEYGNNDAPLYAVLSFYSSKSLNGNFSVRPHVVLTIAERNFFEDGGRVGWDELIRNAIKDGRVMDYNKKERSNLSVIAQPAGLGNITEASLKKNLAQFQKEVKQFRESNNIRYQLKSATELEKEVRELKKERRALENRNRVLTERVAKWRGELRRTETPSVRPGDVKKLGQRFLSDYGSSTDYRTIEGDMTALGKALMADDVSMDTLRPHARAAAEKIIDGVLVQAESGGELLAIRDHLKNVTLRYTDDGSIPDFKDWRRANRRTLKISDKSGLDVDVAYSELTEMFGEGYFPSTIIHPGDQLLRMSEVLDNVGRIYENPFDGYRDAAVTELSNLLIDGMIGEDVRQSNPTFADRQALELQETKARLTQMLIKTREGRDRQVERMRRHYQEQTKAGRERRNATALRSKIARHTADLSRKLLTPTDKQHIPEKLRQSVAALLGSINQESAYSYDENGKLVHNADGDPTKRTQAAIALKNAYDEILKSGEALVIDPDLLGSEGAGLLDQVMAFGNKRMADMNSEELTTVWQAVRAIEQSVSTFNKNLAIERYAGVQELAEGLGSGTRRRANRKLALEFYDPYTFFSAFGEPGKQLFRTLRNAQDKQNVMLKAIQAATEKFMDKEVYKNRLERHEFFVGEDGQRLVLTTEQIMNFCNTMGNGEQALRHVTQGGIRQPEIKRNGKQPAIKRGTEDIRLTADDVAAITGALTETQRKVAEGFQRIASGYLAKQGNEASMTVYGYEKFTNDNYWPIKAAPEGTKQDTEKNPNVAREIKNVGVAKARNPNANNALEIEGIYDVFARHASDMIQYSTLLAPMEDMNRLFNYRYRNAKGNLTGKTVKDVLTDVYGEGSVKYWEDLMRDVQNGIKGPEGTMARLINEVVGNAKAASVGFNFRVVIQQPTAYIRAAAILDPSTMAKGIVGGATEGNGWEKAVKFAPIASIKDTAGFDQSSRYSVAQNVYGGEGGVMEWLNDKSGWLAGKADAVTWAAIWNACEWTVVNEGGYETGSDAFFSRVAQVFTEVIDQSQVVDGILQRAPVMRKSDLLMKQATAFMGEPLKTLNMFMRSYDAWLFEQDTPKRSAAMKKMTRTIGAVLVTDVVNALVQSLMDAARDDDKDKGYWERYLEKLTGFTGDKEQDTFLNVLWGSNIWDNADPLGRIPFAKDVKSLMQGYTVYRMDADAVGDFIKAAQLFIRSTQDEGKKTTLYAAKQLLTAGSKIFGVSVANVGRDVWAVARSVAQSSGNVRMMYEMERAIWRLSDSGNNTRYYKLLYMAMEKDKEAYQYIYEDMKKRGYSDKQLQDGIKKIIQTSGTSGADIKAQLEDIGYSGDEAQEIMDKWAFKEKYGYAYNEKGDAFVEGAITRQQLIDEMVSIGGKTREEAEAYVAQLQCEVDTGISYDDLRGAYSAGRIRYDQAVSYLKRYGGKDDESATKTVEKWKFIGDSDDYDDISAAAVAKYNEYCIKTGMSEDTYYRAWSVLHSMTGEDYDGDGENDAYSKMDKQLEYIGSLNISYDQMFALALASGISEKQINKRAPW